MQWTRKMPGLYYATYQGHEYRIERTVNLAYQTPTWMLSVDAGRPNDCFTTYGEAKQAAFDLASVERTATPGTQAGICANCELAIRRDAQSFVHCATATPNCSR